jgi:glycosyltransferase involved in cell wall biosynthesis
MNDNLIIYVSSRNNYDMLTGEVIKNINTEGFELINIDDNSSNEEIKKGKQICLDNNIVFLENKDRGVQMATQTLIDFINENRPNCKWIVCFQHDIYPISADFFNTLSKYISN